MDCLKNYIGIRQRCATVEWVEPRSRLCIEDLPGISTKSLSSVEPGKYISAVNMINAKINFTGEQFVDMVREIIFPELVAGLVAEQGRGGEFNVNFDSSVNDYHASENVEKGIRLKKANTQLTTLKIVNIVLKATSNAVISGKQLKIKDGIKTYTYDIPDMNPGEEISMLVDYTAKNDKIDIVWNTNDIEPSKGSTSLTQKFNGCTGCGNSRYDFFSAVGLNGTKETTSLYGIRVDFIIECSMEKALCLLLPQLKNALLYAVGVELLKEWVASDSLSFYTQYGKEWAQKTIIEWQNIVDVKLELARPNLTNFLMRIDGNCFTCKSYRYGHVHP